VVQQVLKDRKVRQVQVTQVQQVQKDRKVKQVQQVVVEEVLQHLPQTHLLE